MKLHLPTILRRSLLACLTALPALFSSTLASGALAAGALCSFSLAAEVAPIAAGEDEEDEWTWDQPGNIEWASELTAATGKGNNNTANDLGSEAAASGFTVSGGTGNYLFTNGAENSSLKLDHRAGQGNVVTLFFQNFNVAHLWLTDSVGSANQNNYFRITEAASVTALNNLKNLYIHGNALKLEFNSLSTYSDWHANIILGTSSSSSVMGNGSALSLKNIDLTTAGYLEASLDTKTFFETDNSKLSVSFLQGSGNLELCTGTTTQSGATLTLRDGGDNYSGRLIFTGNQPFTLVLGNGSHETVEQKVGGLSGTSGVSIQAATGKTATLTITGTDATNNVAGGVKLGDGVTLQLADKAIQTLNGFTAASGSNIVTKAGSSLTLGGTSSLYTLTAGAGSSLILAGDLQLTLTGLLDLSANKLSLGGSGAQIIMDYGENNSNTPLIKLSAASAATLVSQSITSVLKPEGMEEGGSWKMFDLSAIAASKRAEVNESLKSLFEALLSQSDWDLTLNNDGTVTLEVSDYQELDTDIVWDDDAKNATWSKSDAEHWLTTSGERTAFVIGLEQNVTFKGNGTTISVQDGMAANAMMVSSGDWIFDLEGTFTVSSLTVSGGDVVFNMSSAITSNITLTGGSLTLASTVKGASSGSLGLTNAIEIPDGATLVFKGWNFDQDNRRGTGAFSGTGTLVLDGCSGVYTRSIKRDVMGDQTGFAGTLVLRGGTYMTHGFPSYKNDLKNCLTKLVVEDSSYLWLNSNNDAEVYTGNTTNELVINGTGGIDQDTGEDTGVIYVTDNPNGSRDISWKLTLGSNATVNVATDKKLGLQGEFNGGSSATNAAGYTLTKTGKGTLELQANFTTKSGSAGSFDVQDGTLSVVSTNTNALASYTVNLGEDGTLSFATTGTYVLTTLSGSGAVSQGSVLQLTNEHTSATAASFSGSVVEGVEVQVTSGSYWKLGKGAELAGSLSADGTVEVAAGASGSSSVGTLKGSGALTVTNGTLEVKTNADTFSGSVTVDTDATLKLGQGSLTISGANSAVKGAVELSSGANLSLNTTGVTSGSVTLGANSSVDLNNTAATGLTIRMSGGGTLTNAGSFAGTVDISDGGSSATFNVNSASGDFTFDLTSGSYVENLDSNLSLTGTSYLHLAAEGNQTAETAFLRSGIGSFTLTTATGFEKFVVDATGILDKLSGDLDMKLTYFLFSGKAEGMMDVISLSAASLVYLNMTDNENGSLTFSYKSASEGDVFISSESDDANSDGSVSLEGYDSLDGCVGTIVDRETSVDLTHDNLPAGDEDGLVMRNVVGTTGGSLSIVGKNGKNERSLVTLQNTYSDDELREYAEAQGLSGMAVDNSFSLASDVEVRSADLQIKHMGIGENHLLNSRTVMTGELSIENGNLLMTSGELELRSNADVEAVMFAAQNSQIIVNASTASVGDLIVREVDAITSEGKEHAEHVRLENEGTLKLKDNATVGAGIVIGNTEASPWETAGTLSVGNGTSISAEAKLSRVVLDVAGDLTVQTTVAKANYISTYATPTTPAAPVWDLAGITGAYKLMGAVDIDITVGGSDRLYSGDLSKYEGDMTINASNYAQIFSGVKGGTGWNLENVAGSHVIIDLMGGDAPNYLTIGELKMDAASATTILMDFADKGTKGIHATELEIAKGADVTLAQYEGTVTLRGEDGEEVTLGALRGDTSDISDDVNWHLKGVRNAGAVYSEGGVLKTKLDNSNKYLNVASNANSTAGALMLWSLENTQTYGGDLAAVDATVLELVTDPTPANIAKADKIMAAVAGSSHAVLGQAVGADVERQLRSIRNRTTTIGYRAPEGSDASQKRISAWLNAETNYNKLDADGMLPGYKATGWGGTVGISVSQNQGTSFGFAISALYNDVDSDAPDRMKADMDTCYFSGFVQVLSSAWRHTFICTIGQVDLDMKRTVNYGAGSYTTHAGTDGMAFGLMYEVGYSILRGEEGTTCVQPVFNIAWRHSQLDAYSETGSSNARLSVDEQTYNTVTFGAGARLQTVIGEDAMNRVSLLEARALVKVDAGDRRGEADVAFSQASGASGKVRSAERGAMGLEVGAGVTVPTSLRGSVFADFSADIRQSQVELNATLGYKVDF